MKLLGKTCLGLLAAATCLAVSSVSRAADDGSVSCVSVTVDMAAIVNTMRGGIGASWHAIEQPIPNPQQERVGGFRRLFGLPKNVMPHSLIPLGYPAEQPPQEERYRLERIQRNAW